MKNPDVNSFVLIFMLLTCTLFQSGCMAQENHNKLDYRLENKGKPITLYSGEIDGVNEIGKILARILSEAEGRYFTLLTKKHIRDIKNGEYVEFFFSNSGKRNAPPSPFDNSSVSKILLSLTDDQYGWEVNGNCNIIFGNPEYEEVNIVFNSNPHINKKDFIKMLRNISN